VIKGRKGGGIRPLGAAWREGGGTKNGLLHGNRERGAQRTQRNSSASQEKLAKKKR